MVAVFLVFTLNLVLGQPACSWTINVSGAPYSFDLSPMTKSDGYYSGKDSPYSYDYEMNVCGVVTSNPSCGSSGGAVCQFNKGTQNYVATIASWTQPPEPTWSLIDSSNPSLGVTQTYINGDICYIFGQARTRTAIINFNCGSSANPDTFTVSTPENTCVFIINITSPYACPAGSFNPIYAVDRTMGYSYLDQILSTGQRTQLLIIPEPAQNPTLAVDGTNFRGYVGTLSFVHEYDLQAVKRLNSWRVPVGGTLRHIAYDPTVQQVYGLWQSYSLQTIQIYTVSLTGVWKVLFTVPPTVPLGSIALACYGTSQHQYVYVVQQEDSTQPNQLVIVDISSLKLLSQTPLQLGVSLQSIAIDSDSSSSSTNIYTIYYDSTQLTYNFASIDGSGDLDVLSTFTYGRVSNAATIDSNAKTYITELYNPPDGVYLAAFQLTNGSFTTSTIQYDQQAVGVAYP